MSSLGYRITFGLGVPVAVASVAVLVLSLFISPDPPTRITPINVEAQTTIPFQIEPVVGGFYVPWSMVFMEHTGPDNFTMLVTQRDGKVFEVIKNGSGLASKRQIYEFDQVRNAQSQVSGNQTEKDRVAGTLSIEKHYNYPATPYVYVLAYWPESGNESIRVMRFTYANGQLSSPTTIISGIPGAFFHRGGRVRFGPDNQLYITTGDAGDVLDSDPLGTGHKNAPLASLPLDLDSLAGKTLRIDPNTGQGVPGNPFYDSSNPNAVRSKVWTYGHRSHTSLDWHPISGALLTTEHGPSSGERDVTQSQGLCYIAGDEINKLDKGANYGWPIKIRNKASERFPSEANATRDALITTRHTDGCEIPNQCYQSNSTCSLQDAYYHPPGGATFYEGCVFPQFRNHFFVGSLKQETIVNITFANNSATQVANWAEMPINKGRIRDVIEGPDGYLYFTTSNTDNFIGRSNHPSTGTEVPERSNDDHVYRIVPAQGQPRTGACAAPTLPPTIAPTIPPSATPIVPSPTGINQCGPEGDIDCSGEVNIFDLSVLLRNFNTNASEGDLDNSGEVNIFDLSVLLRNFGKRNEI